MTTFYTALTQAGQDALANAALTGVPVGFSWMGVGDGDGGRVMVTSAQTGLVNEKYRAPLNRLVIADQGANIIRAEMIMPPEVGGFWLREAALYDDEGVCLAVASVP
ncbi:TPA: phage tail protein, partial [Klebsiella pneumoniae]|nr:phage tail protein [Klebsiella pneumoniae]